MALFTPLINYAGYEHVLGAAPCFVHPNVTIYGVACEKERGTRQNLSVYRVRPGSQARELVHRYIGGGVDAQSQITMGGCLIDLTGALHVWASAVPLGSPPITQTGFVGGFWPPIPDIDDPYTMGGEMGPPGPMGPPGAGGITLLPSIALSPAWDARLLTAGVLVDIPSTFGVPPAQSYLVRFAAVAPLPNVRARAGTEHYPYFLTLNTQVANVEVHGQGWIPGPEAWISPAQGTPTVWLQLLGYS